MLDKRFIVFVKKGKGSKQSLNKVKQNYRRVSRPILDKIWGKAREECLKASIPFEFPYAFDKASLKKTQESLVIHIVDQCLYDKVEREKEQLFYQQSMEGGF